MWKLKLGSRSQTLDKFFAIAILLLPLIPFFRTYIINKCAMARLPTNEYIKTHLYGRDIPDHVTRLPVFFFGTFFGMEEVSFTQLRKIFPLMFKFIKSFPLLKRLQYGVVTLITEDST
jgi:hypothetical protein